MNGVLGVRVLAEATLASTLGRLSGVSVQTWTPILIPASSDMDANFSDLHALQSQKMREQDFSSSPRPSYSPKIQSSGLCFCTDLVRRQGPWTPVMSLASIDHAADRESAARDRRLVPLNRTL
ncbi:hypothetical protein Taro_017687 [Colocasia esculenta]|uniref:Uncharacterized protein n=1 Tax=Colocasia esculenta TaxID=4460 RepID=A0A843UU05_COLES|nr:hypothetical protein [Colocasia esculenta]